MAEADELVLSLLVLAPFVAALGIILIPGRQANTIRSVATAVTGFTFALSIYLALRHYFSAPPDAEFWPLTRVEWLPSLGVGFTLGVDGISVLMVLLNGVVAFAGTLVAWRIPDRAKEFFVLFLLLIAGVFGVFVALDLFFFFFFYELAVIPMYLLIGVWGSSTDFRSYVPPLMFSRTKEYSAMKLTLMLSLGSVLVWVSLIALYIFAENPTFDFLSLRDNEEYSREFQLIFFPLVAVGFGILAGLWPFHTWSPDGHVAAPTSVSMLHAGVLMKLGAYGILRIGMDSVPAGRRGMDAGADHPRHGERGVRGDISTGATRPQICNRVFKREPYGIRHNGACDAGPAGRERRSIADVLARRDDGSLLRVSGRRL